MSRPIFMLLILFELASLSDGDVQLGEFSFDNFSKLDSYLKLDGYAELNSDGLLKLTNYTHGTTGHVFYNTPLQFKNSTNGSVNSFSTTFVFAIQPEYPGMGGYGLAFAISPNKEFPGALPGRYLGLFNATNAANSTNHIVAVELDTVQEGEVSDTIDNRIGLDINNLVSVASASAGYFSGRRGSFKNLNLLSGERMQVWVEYDGLDKVLNITIHPIKEPKPDRPLLSVSKDLSPYMFEFMYVGFSSSSGKVSASHYILGWSFKINGHAKAIDLSQLPMDPGVVSAGHEGHEKMKRVLAVGLSSTGASFLLILIFGALFIANMRKFNQVFEEWEVLYGPYRFNYKDLFKATKGFTDRALLGKGGFGRVYRGTVPSSGVQVAVKRISHDSRQGMREFVAEIATIGRLRHPKLVRLLGYCRRKGELLLVYDYMLNGSLDKFLYAQPSCILSWTQRFKIIKDVASALFYLHQQWVQVIIHRDIKPANVLIDSDMNARLGDFGLAKLCDNGIDPQTSHIAGTLGYIAPELARSGKANTGTDVYSFGVFMLEVACGRRPIERRASCKAVPLIDWVMDCWDEGDIKGATDPRLGNEYAEHEVELVLKLGLLCSHSAAAGRPRMSSVVQFLDGAEKLPDDLNAIIKSQDFCSGPSNQSLDLPVEIFSIPPMTLTESFASHGR